MGLSDLFSGIFDTGTASDVSDILSTASSIDSALGGSGVFDFGGSASPLPVSYQQPAMAYPAMASAPLVARAAAAGIARWSAQFPSLWQALQRYRASGVAMSVPKLWRMFKQVGPNVLAGYIGAAAVADLVTYKATHKSRRMNVANTSALRRSLRRLKGFENLSHRVSAQLGRVASKGRRRSSSRCMSCKKSPCAC